MAEAKGNNGEDLLKFVKKFTDQDTLTIEEELGHGYVRLKVTEAERRQALQDIRSVEDVVKELVRNARDAGSSHIYVTFQKEKGRWRNIAVLDDGSGIPPELHRKIFEARVTSKVTDMVEDCFGVHGRGMALYSIKQVAEDIHIVDSVERSGTIINARIDTAKLPEKKDQSTFPNLEKDDNGRLNIAGGPHNVPRVLMELALQCTDIDIYLGSNAEILATMYFHSVELRKSWASGKGDLRKPLWFELGRIKEGRLLHQFARERLGFSISERNAFRILEDEIHPLLSINELLRSGDFHIPARRADLHRQPKQSWGDNLARRISQDDLALISGSLERVFREVGDKYYLEADNPVIKRRKNHLIITLGLREREDG